MLGINSKACCEGEDIWPRAFTDSLFVKAHVAIELCHIGRCPTEKVEAVFFETLCLLLKGLGCVLAGVLLEVITSHLLGTCSNAP